MGDVMPIEQAEFIDNLQRHFSESTNMCHEDCYRFAFIVWQHKDYLSKVLGADERAKIKDEFKIYNRLEAKFTLNQCKEKDGLYYLDVTELLYGLVDQVLGKTNNN